MGLQWLGAAATECRTRIKESFLCELAHTRFAEPTPALRLKAVLWGWVMQNANSTGQNQKVARAAAAVQASSDGFVEVAILSLAGLTLSLMMLGSGWIAVVAPLLGQ